MRCSLNIKGFVLILWVVVYKLLRVKSLFVAFNRRLTGCMGYGYILFDSGILSVVHDVINISIVGGISGYQNC